MLEMWQYIRAKYLENVTENSYVIAFLHYTLSFSSIFSKNSKCTPYILPHSL